MKKFTRILAVGLALVLVLGMLAACGSSKDDKVTLRFMWWGNDIRHNNTLAMIKLYEAAHPNVKIEAEYGGWDGYQDKLTTQLSGGTAADIMQVGNDWLTDLQKKGNFFADLTKYSDKIDLSMFDSKTLDSYCTVDEKTVAVPAGVSGNVFVFNKSAFEKAGIPADQKWTWDSILDAAKKVHALGKDYYLTPNNDVEAIEGNILRNLVMGKTGIPWISNDNTMGFTRQDLVDAFTYIKALNDASAWPSMAEVASDAPFSEDPRWISGKFACTLSGAISAFYTTAEAIGANADVTVFPTYADAKDTSIWCTPSFLYTVNKNSANVDIVLDFLNYMYTDDKAIETLADCRGVPSSNKGLEVAEAKGFVKPIVSKALELCVDNVTQIPFNSNSGDSEIIEAGQDVVEKLLFDKLTPESAADELISRYTTRLDEIKSGK